jgi:2-methylisocitrate lyase-like PEP mutase family enzyme
VAELGELGVKRVSVGGGFWYTAAGALVSAGRALLEQGTYDYWDTAAAGYKAAHEALG